MNQDVDNTPDDKLTEQQALDQAEAQGITFVDEFTIVTVEGISTVAGPFATRDEAQAEFNKNFKDPEEYTITQTRRQA